MTAGNGVLPDSLASSSSAESLPSASNSDAVPSSSCSKPEESGNRVLITRPGHGKEGRPIKLLSNHFHVKLMSTDAEFFHYKVSIKREDDSMAQGKVLRRKVINKLAETYSSQLSGKQFAYDGEDCLFTVGPLPMTTFDFVVVLEETSARPAGSRGNVSSPDLAGKRLKLAYRTNQFNVAIILVARFPLNSVTLALSGDETAHSQDALRVLDIALKHQQAKRGYLLIKQSFFDGNPKSFVDLGGGVMGCRGLHSSFHTTLGGLSLNMGISTTMIVKPGPVINFLRENQNATDDRSINWLKAKKMMKNMIVKSHNGREFKVHGLSDEPCEQLIFSMKTKNENGEVQIVDVSVVEYFKDRHNITLSLSKHMPCLDVGKPKRPNYIPVELAEMVSLQRYTKALSPQQRASLLERSRQKPQDHIKTVSEAVMNNRYDDDAILSACGINIDKQLTQLSGRVLSPPSLLVGKSENCTPTRGRWNFNNKSVFESITIDYWGIVNFSSKYDISQISRDLISSARKKGMSIERPYAILQEDSKFVKAGPVVRVDMMVEKLKETFQDCPQFVLCILVERKNSELYGPWKRKTLHELGIITQCVAPNKRMNDQYYSNLLLKINAKLGGMNSILSMEHRKLIPVVHDRPTLILGMDVSHGPPGRADFPSVAAVVGSRCWPSISRYRASVRAQSPKVEMIECLFKLHPDGKDYGIINELLVEFYISSGSRKPSQIIIFRDGVSETQFNQVLNIELEQIIKAYQHMGESELPKFTLIVAQKNHHTKLFQVDNPENVPPGTIVDTTIVHPRHYDFFLCPQNGAIGTSRPTHYHVLLDEIGFATDDLQMLVHSLSYVYQKSTSAISIVAPIAYAHLAAQQVSHFFRSEDFDSAASGSSEAGAQPFPELPRIHSDVCSSMFFC